MSTKRIKTELSSNPKLNELVAKAMKAFNALSDEEKAAHRREQAISYVYGEALLTQFESGQPEPSDEEKQALRKSIEEMYDRKYIDR